MALLFFSITNSLMRTLLHSSEMLRDLLGVRVYLPDYLGYQWTLVLVFAALAAWYLVVSWNEETERFVVEM